MTKIVKMRIDGFKRKDRSIEVVFSSENVSVIFGNNGAGKTTFLNVFFAFLAQNGKALEKQNVFSVEVDYLDSNGIVRTVKVQSEKIVQQVTVADEDGTERLMEMVTSEGYNWSAFENSELVNLKSLFFGVQRGVQSKHSKVDEDDIFAFFRNPRERRVWIKDHNLSLEQLYQLSHRLSLYLNSRNRRYRSITARKRLLNLDLDHVAIENINIDQIEAQVIARYHRAKIVTANKIQNALFDTFSLALENNLEMPETDETFYMLLKKNEDRLIQALEDSSENDFTRRLIGIIRSKKIVEKGINSALIKNLLYKMMGELEAEKQYLNSINVLINVFNEHLCDDKKLYIDESSILVQAEDGSHSINELSSGERHLLTFLAFVLIDGSQRDYIIIDEPEISLNIAWQRTLLPLLESLAPKTQIIVASHSPSIAKEDPNYLITIIDIEK